MKRFGQMLGLGAMIAGSPEAAAAPEAPHKTESHESAAAWAKAIVDGCESNLKRAIDSDSATDIVLRARQHLVAEFYFPGGDPMAALRPITRSSLEAGEIVRQIDRLDAMMKIIDVKYGTHISADSKEQLDDMRLKTKRSADPMYQENVRALEDVR